jgi:hypothetical protein
MSIDTLTDISSLIDTESEQRCSLRYVVARRPFCANAAEWACRLSCCGHIKLVCSDHQNIVVSVLPRVFVCTCCGTPQPSIAASWAV